VQCVWNNAVTIERPIEEVFDFVSTSENDPTWVSASLRHQRASSGPMRGDDHGEGHDVPQTEGEVRLGSYALRRDRLAQGVVELDGFPLELWGIAWWSWHSDLTLRGFIVSTLECPSHHEKLKGR
jgi:hypothetical protein